MIIWLKQGRKERQRKNMQKIPIPKPVFDSIFYAYDLRCFCGEGDNDRFKVPGGIIGVNIGDMITLFAPGKHKEIRWIQAEVLSLRPTEIRIHRMVPDHKKLHPLQNMRQKAARAQSC